jgi:hypothetical protein
VRVEFEQRFFAPIAEVASAFADPCLLERLSRAQALCRAELLERVDDDETVREKVRYTFTGALPLGVTAITDPSRITWLEESTLDRRTHRRRFNMVPDHYPDRLSCSGTVELQGNGTITTRRTCAELEVRIPVFAAQIAGAIASGLRDYWAAESRVVQEWLDERASAATGRAAQARQSGHGAAATHGREPPSSGPAATSALEEVVRAYGQQWHETLHGVHELGDRTARAAASWGWRAQNAAEQLVGAWAEWRRDSRRTNGER